MAEPRQNERPDAGSGSNDDVPQPAQDNAPVANTGDQTQKAGVVSDPSAPPQDTARIQPSANVTPRDVATDSDWPGAGATRVQDQAPDEGQVLEQTGKDALGEHAQAQGEARARLAAGEQADPSLPRGEPVGRAGPT